MVIGGPTLGLGDCFNESLEHYMRALDFADEIDDEAAAKIMYVAGDAALRSSDLETASKLAERSRELLPTTIGSLLGAPCRVAADDPELLQDDVWEWLLARASRGGPSIDEVLGALYMRSGDDRLVAVALTAVASAGDLPEPTLDLLHLVQYCAKKTDLEVSQLLTTRFDAIELVVGPLDRAILEHVVIVEAELGDDLEPFELRIHNLPEQFGAGEGRVSDEEAG